MLKVGFPWAVAGIAVFVVLALAPPVLPAWAFRHLPSATLAATLALAVYVIWRRPGARRATPARAGILFVSIMLLFGLSIGALWGHALTTGWVNLGVFPANDAEDFHRTAHQILTDGAFDTPRGRPLANSVLAALLIATGFSLKAVVAIFTAAAGLACWMAAISVWRSHGLGAGLVMFAVLFAFAHGILGSVASEPIGFILGAAAFAVLWDAVGRRSAAGFALGLIALSIGMSARIGALLLLPALLLWASLAFDGARRVKLRAALAGLAAIVAVFAANAALTRIVTPTSPGGFVNAIDAWYTLAVNGREALGITPSGQILPQTRWLQIYQDHPELRTLPPDRVGGRKRAIFLDEIRAYPHAFVVGALLEWKEYFLDSKIFESFRNRTARSLVLILALVGLVAAWRGRRDRLVGFALVCNLAIFASVPFLVGGGLRVQAATVAFTALLCSLGLSALAARIGRPYSRDAAVAARPSLPYLAGALAAATLFLAAIAAGPLRGGLVATGAAPRCEPPEIGLTLRYNPGAALRVAGDGAEPLFLLTTIRHAELAARVESTPPGNLDPMTRAVAAFAAAGPLPVTVVLAPDLGRGGLATFVFHRVEPPPGALLLAVCARQQAGRHVVARIVPAAALR